MGKQESAIVLLHEEIDQYVPPSQTILRSRFRAWHVEALLNQAVELLDRCMAERRELQALNSKRAEERLKLAAMVAEAALLKKRLENNWYGISLKSHNTNLAELSAWEAALKTGYEQAGHLVAEAPGPTHSKNIVHLSAAAAWRKAVTELVERKDRAAADEIDINALRESICKTIENSDAAVNAHACPDGPLCFDAQIESLQERILDDFKDAYDRLSVASVGLELFYGYLDPLPITTHAKGRGTNSLSLLDQASRWARAAVRWMVATLQYEQVFSLQVSVRASVSQGDWDAAMIAIKNNGSAKFSIWIDPARAFAHRYVRFRGVAGFCTGSSDMWSARVSFPRRAVSVQYSGRGESRLEIDQSELPSCVLGRILSRDHPREPELGGVNSLRNASLFGFSDDEDGRLLITMAGALGVIDSSISMPLDFQFEFVLAGLPNGRPAI